MKAGKQVDLEPISLLAFSKSWASPLLDRTSKDLSVGMAKWNSTSQTFGWLVGCAQKQ